MMAYFFGGFKGRHTKPLAPGAIRAGCTRVAAVLIAAMIVAVGVIVVMESASAGDTEIVAVVEEGESIEEPTVAASKIVAVGDRDCRQVSMLAGTVTIVETEAKPAVESVEVQPFWAPENPNVYLDSEQMRTVWAAVEAFDASDYTLLHTAAILGALYRESSLRPDVFGDYDKKAYGLAQWRGSRQADLMAFDDYQTTEVQLGFVLMELAGSEAKANRLFLAATTLEEMVIVFSSKYERCALGAKEKQLRIDCAWAFYEQLLLAKAVQE